MFVLFNCFIPHEGITIEMEHRLTKPTHVLVWEISMRFLYGECYRFIVLKITHF